MAKIEEGEILSLIDENENSPTRQEQITLPPKIKQQPLNLKSANEKTPETLKSR